MSSPGVLVPEGWDDLTVESDTGDEFIQVKSRQPHLGAFPLAEMADHLADLWVRHATREQLPPQGRLVLVLERPSADLSPGEHAIRTAPCRSTVAALLAERVGQEAANALVERGEIWIWPDPERQCVDVLEERLGLPPEACLIHVDGLRRMVGELADDNAGVDEEERKRITITDVTQLIDRVTGLIDHDRLLEAIDSGVCESVDFNAQLLDDAFYLGVDVKPGHVAAGLTLPRQDVVEQVSQALAARRGTLVIGPSGSGKSAVLWLTAYEERQCRWYRIRRVRTPEEADLVVRLVRALEPDDRMPVGLVVDNVGQAGTESWDVLVDELGGVPGVRLLGAAREEDLFVVGTAPRLRIVRLELNPDLASALHAELRERGQTHRPHWREAYEQSNGLLLEYIHLLTRGQRLEDVIDGQVLDRKRQGRNVELQVLAIASTATSWGAEVPSHELALALGVNDLDLSAALERIVDEHLLQRRDDGTVYGLHRLRSRAIFDSVHRTPPPTAAESAKAAVAVVDSASVQRLLSGALGDFPQLASQVIDAAAARVSSTDDVEVVVPVLQGVRLAEFREVAGPALAVLEEEQVPIALRPATMQFVVSGLDFGSLSDLLDPSIARALRRLGGQLDSAHLRAKLLQILPDGWAADLLCRQDDPRRAAQLLAALAGVEDPSLASLPGVERSALGAALRDGSVADIAATVSAGRSVSTDTARALQAAAGESTSILHAVEASTSWTRNVLAGTASDGLLDGRSADELELDHDAVVVRAEYHFVADQLTPDVRSHCKDVAQLVLDCLPDVDLARVVALDPRGHVYGFGDLEIASLWLGRRVLPPSHEVAWNQARVRTLNALLAAESHTDRLDAERHLLGRTATLLEQVGRLWARGGGSNAALARLDQERQALITSVNAVPPPPVEKDAVLEPTTLEPLSLSDPVDSLVRTSLINVISGIAGRINTVAALITNTMSRVLAEASDPARWRLLGLDQPPSELARLAHVLDDIAAVASEIAFGDTDAAQLRLAARTVEPARALGAAARHARRLADTRFEEQCRELQSAVERHGVAVHLTMRPTTTPNTVAWPPCDVLLELHVGRLDQWLDVQEVLVEARGALSDVHQIDAVAVRGGVVVPFLGARVQPSRAYPNEDIAEDWHIAEDRQLKGKANSAYRAALSAVIAISGAAALSGGPRPGAEDDAVQDCTRTATRERTALAQLAAFYPNDVVLQDAVQALDAAIEQAHDELEGSAQPGVLNGLLLDALEGHADPAAAALIGFGLLLTEWDLDPTVAAAWYAELSRS